MSSVRIQCRRQVNLSYISDDQYYHVMYYVDGTALATASSIGFKPPSTSLMRVNCVGTEMNISQCPQNNERTCILPGAGVICPNGDSD